MIASVVDAVLSLHGWAALAVVFAVPALEASAFVGFVFPGEVAILLGGVLAFQGRVALWQVLVAAILGAVIGDSIGFAVGRRWGHAIVRGTLGHLPWIGRHVDHNLERARAYLGRRGSRAVILGRFTAGLRVTIPGLAGMSDMSYSRFLLANVVGGAVWATVFTLVGFFGGAAWRSVERVAKWIGLGLLAAIVGGVIGAHVWRRRHGVARGLARLGPVAWLRRRYPRLSAWLADRLEPGPRGYGLTLVVTFGALCAWAFAALTQDVLDHDELALVDPRLERWVSAHRIAGLTSAAKLLTWLGSSAVLAPLVLVVGGWMLWRHRDARPAVLLTAALAGAIALYDMAKPLVGRPRPPIADRVAITVSGWSFPSGHATQAVAVWGMLAVVVGLRVPRLRAGAAVGAGLVVAVVGVTRIYLGAHWLTDVLGGFSLGAFWLFTILAAGFLHRAHGQGKPGVHSGPLIDPR